ncbi:MAG: M15 family metallopeptidase [Clostridia bacterium]|nr:M15 family metallopeptidase [Clostridia bacterium]
MSRKKSNSRRKTGGRKLEFTIYAIGIIIIILVVSLMFNMVGCVCSNEDPIDELSNDVSSIVSDVSSYFGEESSMIDASSTSESSMATSSVVSSSQNGKFVKNTLSNGDYIEYTKSGAAELNEWYLILVNKDNVLASSWTPSSLTKVADGERLDSRIITAYNDMLKAASKEGLNIYPVSTYRTVDTQNRLFQNKVSRVKAANPGLTQEQAEKEAATAVARPRTSEHECGLAVDFIDVEERFANTKEGKWLKENCTEFGFVLRYEKGKESITNVIYEPWHFRFVGIKHAKRMQQLGMCLEEYVEYIEKGGK